MPFDIHAKRVEEFTADIISLVDRIKLLQKQRLRDEKLKQYLRASAMEEISNIHTEKEKKEEEIMLIKKKQAKASWYKAKSLSSSSKSLSSSCDEKCRPLSTFWTKKGEVDIVNKEVEELPTSASDIQVTERAAGIKKKDEVDVADKVEELPASAFDLQLTEPTSDNSLNKTVQDGSDKNRTFL